MSAGLQEPEADSKKAGPRHPGDPIKPGQASCRQIGQEQPCGWWDAFFPKRKFLAPHMILLLAVSFLCLHLS